MTESELKHLEELCAKATPGPWESGDLDIVGGRGDLVETVGNIYTPAGKLYVSGERPSGQSIYADLAFIAEARMAVLKLIGLVRFADAENKRLRGLVKNAECADGTNGAQSCPWCGLDRDPYYQKELGIPKRAPHADDCPAFLPNGEVR